MNYLRAVLSGGIVWLFLVLSFSVMPYLPGLKNSPDYQAMLVAVLLIPFVILGAAFYYRTGDRTNGFKIGMMIAFTALVLDALITVPLIEIPKGGSYQQFFSYPMLWGLAVLTIGTVYIYWRLKSLNKS